MQRQHIFMTVLGFGLILCLAVALQTVQPGSDAESPSAAVNDQSRPSDIPNVRGRLQRPTSNRPATTAERKAAMASITGQLKAFKEDDYSKAMVYQSSSLKKRFVSPNAFRRAIKGEYPQFANYKSVAFGGAQCDSGGSRMAIEVLVTGQSGPRIHATYHMILEDKIFRVAGVMVNADNQYREPGRTDESLFS